MAAWYSYNLGFRISRANTLHLINHDELRRELIAKKTLCEVPSCGLQAVTILKQGIAAFVCEPHELACKDSKLEPHIVRSIIAEKRVWIEALKQKYFDHINGMTSVVVQQVPGESILVTAANKIGNTSALVAELEPTFPEETALLPFVF